MRHSTFIKSTVILTIATLLSKILGSIFRIPLQNIAGDEVLGIFSLVYPVYMVALILSVAGIPISISKLISESRAKNDFLTVKQIYITASILALLFGLISFTFIYSLSHPIAIILGSTETRLALIIVAITLLIAPYMAVYRGFFQGFGDMRPTAISQVIEQFVRVALILFIAYYLVKRDFSSDVIAGGIMVGSIAGVVASLIYLRIKFTRFAMSLPSVKPYYMKQFINWSKAILKISIPIAFGAITLALMNFVDSITIPSALKYGDVHSQKVTYLYGIYGRGISLVQIATVFAASIVLPLIPTITSKITSKDIQGARQLIEKSFYMTHLISWPAAVGIFSLALPLNLALFTDLQGTWMIAMIGFSSVFTSFSILSTGVLQGINQANRAAILVLLVVVIKSLLNIFLVAWFGLIGAAISTLFIYIILFVFNMRLINRYINITIFTKNTWKIIFSSLVMGLIIGLPPFMMALTNWTRTQAFIYVFSTIIFGSFIYFLQLFIFNAFDKNKVKNFPLFNKFFK